MAHLTFVRPAFVFSEAAYSNRVTPPLGIAYMAAMLQRGRHEVAIVDAIGENVRQLVEKDGYLFQGLTLEETLERIRPTTDLIGVSCMFTQDWPYIRRVLTAIRERFPRIPIIVGGEHISALPEFCMNDCPAIDICAVGEGEETIAELADAFDRHADLESISGIVLRRKNQLVRTPPRPRIKAVDSLPWPAWDLFPMEVYISQTNGHGVYLGRDMPILATRGCPFQCTFCSNPSMYGTTWAARKPELVLDEIAHYIEKYNAANIDFYDLTMILKKDWILQFCRLIEERNLHFTWQLPSGTRSEVVDEELSAALYRTGCSNLVFSPESGSEETLVKIKKKVSLPKVVASIKAAVKHNVMVKCNLVIGFPHERRKNILESIWFALRLAWLGVADLGFYIFSPYPGSELFDQINEEKYQGKLNEEYFRSLVAYSNLAMHSPYCKHVGPRELSFWRFLGMASFYALRFLLHPRSLIRMIINVMRDKSETMLERRLGVLVHPPKKIKADVALLSKA